MEQNNDKIDILLVDDRPDGLIALEAVLSEFKNYNLVMASSGRRALELLPSYDFAMILLDVQMPELDGFETAELIKSQRRFRHIPIIFVTAINKEERYVFRGYESGAFDYIFKPFDPYVLRSKVAVFADLHLKNRQLNEQSIRLLEREALEHKAYVQSLELEGLRRYRNLADAIPHMVWQASTDGSIEYYNQVWCEYTGLSLAQSLGAGWQTAFHPRDLDSLLEKWALTKKNSSFEIECQIRRYDGVYRWHWIKAIAEYGSDDRHIAWLGTCTDIEDRKLVESQLLEAQRASESANNAKTQFLANMSHEIRTPLNAILGFTDLLLDPHLSAEERTNAISVVRRNGQQLVKIIDEILDISKVEAGGLEIENIETDVLNLVSGVRSLMNVAAVKKKVDLRFDLEGQIPRTAVTDPTRLRQILLNVVGNAIKFTKEGVVKVQVQFDGRYRKILRFLITDTGVGLDESLFEKVFVPFSQADASTTRIYGGTGLGLPLSRRLAQAMGGDVWIQDSQADVGSTFVVEVAVDLPKFVKWVTKLSDVEWDERTALNVSQAKRLKGRRILLVEDARDNQILIGRFLHSAGVDVDIASNGQEGVEKALNGDYEVILMDIQMPLLDGYEATSQLRSVGYKKPIIALTAHALKEEKEKCLGVGCNEHLTKPIDRNVLIDSLSKFVGH